MKIVIVGAGGQLGWELLRRGSAARFDIIPLDLPEFDITHHAQVKEQIGRTGICLVINAAAHTAVDQAESEPERAFAINRDGPSHLASCCAENSIPLIHVSTDYVFDGSCGRDSYCEKDPVRPLGVYGQSKSAGEDRVRQHLEQHIILRTAWLYGVHGQNFVKTMLRLGKEHECVRVVSDQYGSPTYAGDLADAILAMAGRILDSQNVSWGTFHYCGKGEISWHGFAEKIFELARPYISMKVKKVEAIATRQYPTPAKRPVRSVLDCSLIKTQYDIHPRPWQEGLEDMIHRFFNNEDNALQIYA